MWTPNFRRVHDNVIESIQMTKSMAKCHLKDEFWDNHLNHTGLSPFSASTVVNYVLNEVLYMTGSCFCRFAWRVDLQSVPYFHMQIFKRQDYLLLKFWHPKTIKQTFWLGLSSCCVGCLQSFYIFQVFAQIIKIFLHIII